MSTKSAVHGAAAHAGSSALPSMVIGVVARPQTYPRGVMGRIFAQSPCRSAGFALGLTPERWQPDKSTRRKIPDARIHIPGGRRRRTAHWLALCVNRATKFPHPNLKGPT